MKHIILIALCLTILGGCKKLDNKRDVEYFYSGQFYDNAKMTYVGKTETENVKVKVGDHFKKSLVSNPTYPLSGKDITVAISVDDKEVYRETKKQHEIDILID